MPLTTRQAFRAGFLLRCAEENLTEAQTSDRVKRASVSLSQLPGSAARWLGLMVPALTVGGGALAGAGIGSVAAAMADTSDQLPEVKRPPFLDQLQRAELIAAYRLHADQAMRQAALLRQRHANEQSRKPSPYGV